MSAGLRSPSLVPGLVPVSTETRRRAAARTMTEPRHVRALLIGFAAFSLGLIVLLPLVLVFVQALSKGVGAYFASLATAETWAAIKLTLIATAVVVPANTAFGVAAAWLLAKHRFRGKKLLTTLIDLPFSVSPVISGLIFVLLFGAQGLLGPWLQSHDIKIIFALPGILLATAFVTFPFVAREVLPALEAAGNDEEEAALTLGARGFTIFWRVTMPKIKWALLYGVVLCSARAMGEFGAVSVVSGHVRGETNTMPLQVEILYNEYEFTGAFAVASLLTLVAVAALTAKKILEHAQEKQ
jgi:sulfate transport system permease protein